MIPHPVPLVFTFAYGHGDMQLSSKFRFKINIRFFLKNPDCLRNWLRGKCRILSSSGSGSFLNWRKFKKTHFKYHSSKMILINVGIWRISPSRYILKYSRTLLKFIVQKVLTVLLPFHHLDLKFVNVWPQKKIFFTVTFSTFNSFFSKQHFNVFIV